MLGMRSRFSAGDVGAARAGEWEGTPTPAKQMSTAELLAQNEQKKNNRIILFVFCVMFLLEVFVNFDSGVIPAILVTLQKHFAIDGAAAGLLGSLPYIGLVVSSPFVGRGLTAFSPKWFCFITMVVNLFATGLLGLAVQKWMLFLSRLLIGLSQAGFSIYAPVWVDQFAPAEKLTLWMGLAQGGVVVGTMLGCVVAGSFDSDPGGEETSSNWRYALLIQAVGLFLLLVVWFSLPRRFVDINMHQPHSVEAIADAALEARASKDVPVEGEEEEEEATGVGGTSESPQKAQGTTTSSIFGLNSNAAAAEQKQQRQPVQQEQQPCDMVVVVTRGSEAPQKDVELANRAPEAKDERTAAVDSRPGAATAAADICIRGRRRSTAGAEITVGRDQIGDAGGRGRGETAEGRRWSTFASIAPGALFGRKDIKRPSTESGAVGLSPHGAATGTHRPSSNALSEGGHTTTSSNRRTPEHRPSQAPRYLQSTDTIASNEGLPQFRRNFISNLLPLDFIATSPTFARRSSQLHPGPAPGAAAAVAAAVASGNNSSCSSSSSVGSPRKELRRNSGGGRGAGPVPMALRRSSSVLVAAGGGIRAGALATAVQQETQHQMEGGSSNQPPLREGVVGEGAVGAAGESTFPGTTGEAERGRDVAGASATTVEETPRDSARAAAAQQQQQQREHLFLGRVSRPATAKAGSPLAPSAEKKQAVTVAATIRASVNSVAADGNTAAAAAELESAAAVQEDVISGSATSPSSSKPSGHEGGIEATSPVGTATGGGADMEAAAGASRLLTYSQCCGASGAAATGPASVEDSRASATGGETADARDADRRGAGNDDCSVRFATVENGHQQRHGAGASGVSAEGAAAATAAAEKRRRGSAAGDASDTPATAAAFGGVVGGAGLAGAAAPNGGVNEVQYQRIFMTPHASTLAFEAFNWAAGVADPLLLVRDNSRQYSSGGGVASSTTNLSGAGLPTGISLHDKAHPVGAHCGRRRRSTAGGQVVGIRGPSKTTLSRATSRKAAPREFPEVTTADRDDSVAPSASEAATVGRGECVAGMKTAYVEAEQIEKEHDAALKQGKLVGAGRQTGAEQAAEQCQGAHVEAGQLLRKADVEAAAAGSPSEAGGVHLQDRASAVLTERSAATLPGQPRTFDVWQSISMLFSSPLYICVTISLCALFFEVTAIQFWSISYFQEELQVPKAQVLVAFNVTAATGPILGVLAGGWFIDFIGGYKTEKGMMKTLLILGSWATICLVLGTFACWVPNFAATIAFMWGILFFGGCILPAATGIVIASVPVEVRAFGSGFCMMIYNVFGYVLGTAVPGGVVQAAGLAWGMRMVFLWSLFGVGGLFAGAFVVWRLRIRPSYYICTYGVDGQENGELINSGEDFRNDSSLHLKEISATAAKTASGDAKAAETSGDVQAPSCVPP